MVLGGTSQEGRSDQILPRGRDEDGKMPSEEWISEEWGRARALEASVE